MFRVAIAAVFWSWSDPNCHLAPTIALFPRRVLVPLLPPETSALMTPTFELSCCGADRRRLGDAAATLPLLGMTFVIEVFVYPDTGPCPDVVLNLLFLLRKARCHSRSITTIQRRPQ